MVQGAKVIPLLGDYLTPILRYETPLSFVLCSEFSFPHNGKKAHLIFFGFARDTFFAHKSWVLVSELLATTIRPHPKEEVEEEARRRGAFDCLIKPFTLDELRGQISALEKYYQLSPEL